MTISTTKFDDIVRTNNSLELLEMFMNIDQYPELKESIKAFIPMKTINDIESVDPEYQQHMINFDPLYALEQATGQSYRKSSLDSMLVCVHMKNAINSVIEELTQDFSERNSTWDEYLAGIERLGFRQLFISQIPEERRKDDVITGYWNDAHSMLWIVDSFTFSGQKRKVNSSNLYFNGKTRDPNDKRSWELAMTRGVTAFTDIVCAHIDMRESPTYKLFKIIEHFELTPFWAEYGCFDSNFNNCLELIEDEVVEKMTAYNVVDITDRRNVEGHSNKLLPIVQPIIDEMTEEELLHSTLFSRSLQYILERESFIPKKYVEMLSDKVEPQFMEHAVGLFAYKIYKMKVQDNREYGHHYDRIMDTLTAEELVPIYKRFVRVGEEGRKYEISPDVFQRLEDKVNSLKLQ